MNEEELVSILLVERQRLIAYLISMLRKLDQAEDVYQEVCLLALKKRETIADQQHLRYWLRTAARLQALNFLKKMQNRQLSLNDEILDLLEPHWAAHDAEDDSAVMLALKHCMDLLPKAAGALIRQHYVQGISYTALAESLRRPVNSLYVTFSRIHAALADCVNKRLSLPEENR